MLLANAWLDGDGRQPSPYDWEVERHLRLPTKHNPHASVVHLNTLAERIVFVDDVPSLLYHLDENKQLTVEGILQTVKLPYDCFWIEYGSMLGLSGHLPHDKIYFGALVRRGANDRVRMYIIAGSHYGNRLISSVVYVTTFNEWPPAYRAKTPQMTPFGMREGVMFGFDIDYAYMTTDKSGRRYTRREYSVNVAAVVTEVIFGIFLVTQPKVYDDVPMKHSDKVQRRRAKAGKQPLLDYRKIRLHVLAPPKRYAESIRDEPRNIDDPDSERAIQHRRYHKVMGHFRHYTKGDNPHTTWIEPHYRGDPKLGVTFTERDVMR